MLVSAKTVKAMAHSLQEIDSADSADDKSSSTDTTQIHMVSYEDVPFEDGPKIPPVFITGDEVSYPHIQNSMTLPIPHVRFENIYLLGNLSLEC